MSLDTRPNLLLHVCCAGCGVSVATELEKDYRVSLYYYNPNIYPAEERTTRHREAARIAGDLPFVADEGSHGDWLAAVAGLETEPERGSRCLICYRLRLEATAAKALTLDCAVFGTTLTTSPHKDAAAISRIGCEIAAACGLAYLDRDFKKKDGFKRSAALSRALGIYRQDYCGCEFSRRREGRDQDHCDR